MDFDVNNCPKCHSTNKIQNDLQFFISVCGHIICNNCYVTLHKSKDDECVECHYPLTPNDFRLKVFGDNEVEAYLVHRNHVKRIFNKDREDFETDREYGDYLEEVECLIHDLMDSVKRDETKEKIQQYQIKNKNEIKLRRNRPDKEMVEFENWELRNKENHDKTEREIEERRARIEACEREYSKKLLTVSRLEEADDWLREKLRSEDLETKPYMVQYEKKMDVDNDNNIMMGRSNQVLSSGRSMYSMDKEFIDTQQSSYVRQALANVVLGNKSLKVGGGYTMGIWLASLNRI